MARKKKPASVEVTIKLPVPVWAFYEGVAAYSRVSLDEAIRVVLAIEMSKRGADPTTVEPR